MAKNKKTRNNNGIRFILCVLLLLIGCGVGFFAARKLFGDGINDTQSKPDAAVIDDDNTTPEKNDNSKIAGVENEDKTPIKYDGEDPNKSEVITGSITRSDVTNGKAVIRVNIDQYLSSGTCAIAIGSFSESANIIANASTSTCEGFDIDIANLSGLSGETSFSIEIISGDKKGTINGSISL